MSSSPHQEKPPGQHRERIDYVGAFRAILDRADWFQTVLLGGLALLIPVLGQIVTLGWQYEAVELMHRRPGSLYPAFDFNRFAAYLQRGVWPFLIAFIVQSLLGPLFFIGFQVPMMIIGAIGGQSETAGTILLAIGLPMLILAGTGLLAGVLLVTTPLYLRAGLSQDVKEIVQFEWIQDFLKRMWVETLLVQLSLMLAGVVLAPLGLITCCVGFGFIGMFVSMGGAHLNLQLYELYLSRGGDPIPLKPLPADAPPLEPRPKRA